MVEEYFGLSAESLMPDRILYPAHSRMRSRAHDRDTLAWERMIRVLAGRFGTARFGMTASTRADGRLVVGMRKSLWRRQDGLSRGDKGFRSPLPMSVPGPAMLRSIPGNGILVFACFFLFLLVCMDTILYQR